MYNWAKIIGEFYDMDGSFILLLSSGLVTLVLFKLIKT